MSILAIKELRQELLSSRIKVIDIHRGEPNMFTAFYSETEEVRYEHASGS